MNGFTLFVGDSAWRPLKDLITAVERSLEADREYDVDKEEKENNRNMENRKQPSHRAKLGIKI